MSETKDENLVSVIVPVFNTEAHLSHCLDSILNQSYHNIEVICIDDGSTDNSLKVLRKYAESDSRVRVFAQPFNKRQGAARNKGLEEARGEYVFFVDSDDTINFKAIEVLVGIIEKESADAVCFPLRSVIDHKSDFPSIEKLKYIITNNPLAYSVTRNGYRIEATPCRLYRRKLLEDVRFIEEISYEDEAFTWETMLHHPRIAILNTSLYNYLNNPNSTMHRKFDEVDIRYYCKVIDHLLKRFPGAGEERKCLERLILPRLLKEQFFRIRSIEEAMRDSVLCTFAHELKMIKKKRAYSLLGIGIRRHIAYRKVFRKL